MSPQVGSKPRQCGCPGLICVCVNGCVCVWCVPRPGEGDNEMVRLLVEGGADVNGADHLQGETPLFDAAANGWTDTCLLLLQLGADPCAKNKLNYQPYFCAQEWSLPMLCSEQSESLGMLCALCMLCMRVFAARFIEAKSNHADLTKACARRRQGPLGDGAGAHRGHGRQLHQAGHQ